MIIQFPSRRIPGPQVDFFCKLKVLQFFYLPILFFTLLFVTFYAIQQKGVGRPRTLSKNSLIRSA